MSKKPETPALLGARLAMGHAITRLHNSVHPGSVNMDSRNSGENLRDEILKHISRMQAEIEWWEKCRQHLKEQEAKP